MVKDAIAREQKPLLFVMNVQKKGPSMDNWTRLNVLSLIFLIAGIGVLGYYAQAVPAPSIGATVEPGSLADVCQVTVYADGSTILAKSGTTGANTRSGTVVATVIQAAINNDLTAGRAVKEKICLKGDFTIAATLTIPSYTVLQIDGRIKANVFSLTPFIRNSDQAGGNTDIDIIGGIIDGTEGCDTSGSGATNAIDFQKVTRFRIQGVTLQEISGMAIRNGLTSSTDTGNSYGVITDNIMSAGDTCGFVDFLGDSNRITVSDNVIYSWDTSITIYDAQQINIVNNKLSANRNGGGPGVEIIPQAAADITRDIIVEGNIINSARNKGMWIHQNSVGSCGTVSNIIVSHNLIRDIYGAASGRTGIEIGNFCAMDKIKLLYNTIISPFDQGIFLSNNAVSDTLRDSMIIGNTILSPGQEAIRLVGIQSSIISDNRIQNSTGAGIHILRLDATTVSKFNIINGNIIRNSTGAGGYGIQEDTSNHSNQIRYNTLIGNAQAAILIAGANTTVQFNIGYATENRGTTTISASTTVTVTHGLAGTPTVVNVTPRATGYGTFAVTARDSTGFTITVTTSGTYGFDWYAEFDPA